MCDHFTSKISQHELKDSNNPLLYLNEYNNGRRRSCLGNYLIENNMPMYNFNKLLVIQENH